MHRSVSPFQAGTTTGFSRWLGDVRRAALGLATGTALAVQAQTPRQMQQPAAPAFLPYEQSDNVFQASPDLPVDLRRVAVLPLASEGFSSDLSQGCETLGPLLLAELIKTKKFEAVTVNPQDLQHQTGRFNWTGAEILPADFFDSLQRVYGCNAVLFCQLTVYHAYAPLAVGWRMKLVDARTGRILWALDKVFAPEPHAMLSLAQRCHIDGLWIFHDPSNDWLAENSPLQFGQFAIAKALSTLPNRKEMAKVSLPSTDVPSKQPSNKNCGF
jgi:hypothetical protein